jgi:hypothetical protein
VLLDLVPAGRHQPDLFAADNRRRQKLSPLVDRINDRYGRCTIGFGLLPPEVRALQRPRRFPAGAGKLGVLTALTGWLRSDFLATAPRRDGKSRSPAAELAAGWVEEQIAMPG